MDWIDPGVGPEHNGSLEPIVIWYLVLIVAAIVAAALAYKYGWLS